NAAASHTFDHRHFDHRVHVRLATVMPDKIVSWRNVKMADFHRAMIPSSGSFHMKESSIDSQKIIRRKRDGELEYLPDDRTIEEPLEMRIGRKTLATTMRTPGHDDELAAGFLLSEAIVHKREELKSISVPDRNTVIVDLAAGVKFKPDSAQRFGTISSSCGIFGKNSV